MTDSTPQESEELPAPLDLDDSSPLRNLISEAHEIHAELLYAGFDRRDAAQIVAHMLSEARVTRGGYLPEGDYVGGFDPDDEDYLEDDGPV